MSAYSIQLRSLLLVTGFLSGICLHSNATQAAIIPAADLAIVGYQSDSPDSFSLLALDDIAAGTVVFITDEGWRDASDAFLSSTFDSTLTWTAPAGGISAGTVLHSTSMPGLVGSINLSDAGDTLILYQTADDNPATNPKSFVYGFNANDGLTESAGGWQVGIATTSGSSSSEVPTSSNATGATEVVTDGGPGNFFGLIGEGAGFPNFDNYAYTGPTTAANKDDWLARIHTVSNWTTTSTAFNLSSTVLGGATSVTVLGDTGPPTTAVPEPSSMAMMGLGAAIGFVAWRRRRSR